MLNSLFAILLASLTAVQSDSPRGLTGASLGPHPVTITISDAADGFRQIVWAPAARPGSASTLSEIVSRLCPDAAAVRPVAQCLPDLANELARRGSGTIEADLDSLAATPVGASLDAPRLAGRRPRVILQGSINSRGGEFFSLGEALASRGYEVTVIVDATPSANPPYDAAAVTRARRGLDVAREGRDDPHVLVAWSFGGVPAALEAVTDPSPRAFVSLDSALRYGYGVQLLRAEGFRPDTFSGPVLSVRPGTGNAVPQDDALVAQMSGAGGVVFTAGGLRHADFSDLRGAFPALLMPESARRQFQASHTAMIERVVDFIEETLPATDASPASPTP